MKLSTIALSLLAPLGLLAAAPNVSADPAPEASAHEIAEKMQGFYNKTKTFKSGFRQKYTIKAYNKKKESEGSVFFAKPGKMSWRYTNGNRVVSDGKKIKVFESDNKQMYEQSVDKSQYPAALAFLSGDGDLKKSFRLKKLDSSALHWESGWVIQGTPRDPTPAYQRVLFYVDVVTGQARRVMLLDAQGNKNRFDFLTPSVNTKPSVDEFKFEAPPGTQVVKP